MTSTENAAMEVEATPEQKLAESRRILSEGKLYLARNVKFLERGIAAAEVHYTHRALRTIFSLRKRLQPDVLAEAIATQVSKSNSQSVADCLRFAAESLGQSSEAGTSTKACEPEVCLFLCLLVQLYHLDHN
ncbi:26S proteasome non-ATPase regulatory subunit, partial [Coemansia sp. BCRC 34301]